MSAVLFVTGEALGDLLKAHKKLVTVPGHVRRGKWIDPYQMNVLVSDDHDTDKVASGQGSFYQKQAHKKLAEKVDGFHTMSPDAKAALVMAHATKLQAEASASAALSQWKKLANAGQNPKPAMWAAFYAQDAEGKKALLAQVEAKAGGLDHLHAPSNPVLQPAPTTPTTPTTAAPGYGPDDAPVVGKGSTNADWFSSDESKDGLAKLSAMVAKHGADFGTEEVFGKPASVKMFFGPGSATGAKLEVVKLSDIIPSQDKIDPEAVAGILKTGADGGMSDGPPEAIRLNGKIYLQDGHHRVSAMALAGRTHVSVMVADAIGLGPGAQPVFAPAAAPAGPTVDTPVPADIKKNIDEAVADGDAKYLQSWAWPHNDHNPHIQAYAAASLMQMKLNAAKPAAKDPMAFISDYLSKPSVTLKTGKTVSPKEFIDGLLADGYGNPEYFANPKGSQVGFLSKPGSPKATLNDKMMFYADSAFAAKKKAAPVVTVSVPPGDIDPAAAVAAMETGAYYQKEAIKKLKAEHGPAWDAMHPAHQHELAQAKYKALQGAASQAAAVSGWKKSLLAGKPPTPSELLAVANMAKDGNPKKVAKLIDEVSKAIGPDKLLALITQGNAKIKKAPVSVQNQPPPSAAGSSPAINQGAPSVAENQTFTPVKPAATPAAPQTVTVKKMATQLCNTQPGHSKSWSASLSPDGLSMMTKYGKIGAKQQTTIKTFTSQAAAAAAINKLIDEKKDKGYSYHSSPDHEWTVPVMFTPAAAPAAPAKPAATKGVKTTAAGPKNGDTKQGADGLLYFKDGHWHKMGLSDDAVEAAANSKYASWKMGTHGKVYPTYAAVVAAAKAGDVAAAQAKLDALKMQFNAPKTTAKAKAIVAALLKHQKEIAGKQKVVVTTAKPSAAAPAAAKKLTQAELNAAVSTSGSALMGNGYASAAAKAALTGDAAWLLTTYNVVAAKNMPKTKVQIEAIAAAMGAALPGVSAAASPAAAAAAAPPTPKTKAPPPVKVGGAIASSIDTWTQTGPQKGSNPGGKFKDKQGAEWYCKFPADKNVALNEILAAKFYQMLGVDVPTLKLVSQNGKIGIASKWVDGMSKGTAAQLAKAKGAHEAFAIDAWLANWDVVGLSNDNLMLGKDGGAVRVDVGGSLVYRAQGVEKGADFGDTVPELETLKDPKKNDKSAAVFAGATPESMQWGLRQLNKMKPSQITELVEKIGPGSTVEKEALAAKLIARREFILKKFGIQDQWTIVHKLDPSNLPVNPADLPAPIQFTASSKAHVNAQNTKDSEALIAFASKGNLTALKDYQYDAVDKETSAPLGKKSILDHPSKPLKEQWAGLVELLQSISTPPMPTLSMPSLGSVGALEEISDFVGSFSPQERVETVAAEHRMHFFMALSHIDDIAGLVTDMKWSFLKSGGNFVQAAKAKHSSLGAAVKKYISSVQSSGAINHSWSQGKTEVNGMGIHKLTEKIYAEAQELPEGTTLIRGMTDTSAGKSMCKQLMACVPGTVLQNTDSMCASYNENHSWGGDVQMTIRCAKGCKASLSFATGNFGGEHEITTLPGQRYVVLSTKKINNTVHLEVLMLPPHDGYVAELGKLSALGKAMSVVFTRGL